MCFGSLLIGDESQIAVGIWCLLTMVAALHKGYNSPKGSMYSCSMYFGLNVVPMTLCEYLRAEVRVHGSLRIWWLVAGFGIQQIRSGD